MPDEKGYLIAQGMSSNTPFPQSPSHIFQTLNRLLKVRGT